MTTLDLRAFGPVGFQDFYLERQGYKGKNLLKLIADRCFDINLDFCAITSCSENVKKGSIHDRFGYLINSIKTLPKEYKTEVIERNYHKETEPVLLIIEKNKHKTVLINSQAVLCRVGDKRVDHMIIGSNQVPSFTIQPWEKNINLLMTLEEVVDYSKKRSLIQIVLHPFAHQIHNSVGENIIPYLEEMSAIEGQCSEFSFDTPNGPFSKSQDELAQAFAKKYNKQYIAVSAAHRIEDIGLSHIKTSEKIRYDNVGSFLEDLKTILENQRFENIKGYQTKEGIESWAGNYFEAIKKREKDNKEDL